jgi:long-chain acyl-CoA synthetase
MVIGEGMPYLAALLILNRSSWVTLAQDYNLDPDSASSLHAPAAKQAVIEKLEILLHAFPGNTRIRTVALLLDDWSITNGLLTPTLKLKRGEIETRYAETIKNLYKGHEMLM